MEYISKVAAVQDPILDVTGSVEDKALNLRMFIKEFDAYLPSCVRAQRAACITLLIAVLVFVFLFLTEKKKQVKHQGITEFGDPTQMLEESMYETDTLYEQLVNEISPPGQQILVACNGHINALERELKMKAKKARSGQSLPLPEIDSHFNKEEDE